VKHLISLFALSIMVCCPLLAEESAEKLVTGARETGKVTVSDELRSLPELKDPLVFVARNQYRGDHHNTATMFQTGEINEGSFAGPGAIKVVDFQSGIVTTLLEVPQGVVRDIEVSYDAKKILFSMRLERKDDYHIWEMNVDGSGLKQLTFGSGISDFDPIYLPNGQIMFSSTREPKFCMCNRHIMGNLFTMDADGANIQQIGHSTLHEGHPSVMPDGRVIYDRWEYVDRNFGDAQGSWIVNPDGTNHAIYWGNNTNSPGGVLDNRAIPGTDLVIATFSSCHDRPWGAIAIVDRKKGIDGREPVVRTWPKEAIEKVGVGNYDTFVRVRPKYEDPYPLNDKLFLCSRMTGDEKNREKMGIYLLDMADGPGENGVLLYEDEKLGCYDPMPLRVRKKESAIPSRIDLTKDQGYFFVADCSVGFGMAEMGVKKGDIKYLRVVESPEKRFWTHQAWMGSGTQAPGMAFDDFNNKRIIGTVPVKEDGSVFFAVPADTYVYFQVLDEQGRMIQSMRSGVIVRPGETNSCTGCHENRLDAPVPYGQQMAYRGGPKQLEPWYGPTRLFSYTAEVQPAFDKHCVSCHDYGKEAGEKLNLAGDLGTMFNTSYYELRTKEGMVNVPGAGPFQKLKPKTWGSYAGKLADVLINGHSDKKLDKDINVDKESFDRIVTWLDINAPYYPTYASAYRNHRFGRSPLKGNQSARLRELTGVNVDDQRQSQMVSFTRPEISPCLKKLDPGSDKYKEALAIITAGKEQLAKVPRADMPGFKLVDPIEIAQQEKYEQMLAAEAAMRRAIAAGEKHYDKKP